MNTTLTKSEIKTLTTRLACYNDQLATCTTEAMRKCVTESRDEVAAVLKRGSWQ